MAIATTALLDALLRTALRLERGSDFRWTHMGACICGNLVQTISPLTAEEIHRAALQRPGDWSEQAREYCPSSGMPMDHILEELHALGLEAADIRHLEHLSDPAVLRRAVGPAGMLNRLQRHDVILYLRTWAGLLSESADLEGRWARQAG
jgi:hypothetical protein